MHAGFRLLAPLLEKAVLKDHTVNTQFKHKEAFSNVMRSRACRVKINV
jgi:hypothetical protein